MGKVPAQETQFTYGNTRNPLVNNNTTDCAQYVGPNGDIVSWIDSEGFGQGNLAMIPGVLAVQTSLLVVDTNQPQQVVNNNIATSLYNIALNMESRGDGAPGATLTATISWTPVQGGTKDVTLVLDGTTDNIQQENYVMLALAGTTITVTTAFSGTSFHYDFACSVILLPIGQ